MAKKKNTKNNKNNTETEVVLEMPEEVVIKLIQENLVKNYELLVWLFNISTPITIGFWTAFFTIDDVPVISSLFISSLGFSIFSIALLIFIVKNRKQAFSDSVRKRVGMSKF